jgi:chromosome segregation protein
VHLRTIKLRGFKSFPDPVEVRLEPGVAVVVGPNGSGKSNVADAIVWAAGSLAPSELRAEKPDDVLFAGSGGKPSAPWCEVELLFDNADGGLGIDFSEVSIARRLHRGGEGQYLVNGAAVRRLDLVELLADAGLGAGMHSIVGQGKVEAVLASKPEERRALVEEAAGLGKFKQRRHRAELKLSRVAVEVDRARDLEAEVRKRLRPLALQASAAERAERLGGEIDAIRARLAELQLAALESRLVDVDARRTASALERRRTESELESVLGDREQAEAELADAAGRREAATALLYRLRSAGERLALRRERAEELAAEISAEGAAPQEDGPSAADLEIARSGLGEALAASATARAELDAAADRRRELDGIGADERGIRDVARESLSRLRVAGERLTARRESASALLEELCAELTEATDADRRGLDPRELERAADDASARARTLARERDELAERTALARNQLAALDRALVEREGLPPAVRALAEEGEPLALAGLSIAPGDEKAVAAALAWRASALVAEDSKSAFALLERARAAGLGSLVVLVGDRAEQLVQTLRVVPADRLLEQTEPAVTPEGHGYDPERGELWFAGETAEAVLLELERRRAELAGEIEQLDRGCADAVDRAEQAALDADEAERAFAAVAPRLRTRHADPDLLGALTTAATRLDGALTHAAAAAATLESPLVGAETAAAQRIGTLAAEVAELAERELDLRAGLREHERVAAEAAAAVRELESQLVAARRRDPIRLAALGAAADRLRAALASGSATAERLDAPVRARADAGALRTGELAERLRLLGGSESELRRAAAEAAERAAAIEAEGAVLDAELREARRRRAEITAEPVESDDGEELAARLERLERRREELGRVNPFAKEEYAQEKERLDELALQREDLERSLTELEQLRNELTETVERRFAETFAAVERHFAEAAATLFPGGEGRLRLVDRPEEEGEAGVEVELRPAGKRVTRLSLLSGGEKALGAIAFLFALFLARPCPFYLLDEVEAALDDPNIGRFVGLLREYSERAQFIVITHQKRTMEAADVLYGVTMGGDGISQIVSRRMPANAHAAVA